MEEFRKGPNGCWILGEDDHSLRLWPSLLIVITSLSDVEISLGEDCFDSEAISKFAVVRLDIQL